MKALSIIINWICVILIFGALIWGCRFSITIDLDKWRLPMSGWQVLVFAFSLAFTWVEILRWGNRKPFTCTKCMTGWFSLLLALLAGVDFWYLYIFVGLTVGSLFEAIKMRWL